MIGWIIAIVIVAGLGIAGRAGWSKLEQEHQEARNLPIQAVDFSRLKDGSYHGTYAGGMYGWRTNECQVDIAAGRVNAIQLVSAKENPNNKTLMHKDVYERVIQAQTLQVDTISGATLTCRAYLKAVENALLQARQE